MTRVAAKHVDGPDPIDLHVGRQLRFLRVSRRMSQEHLGKAVGLTFQQIQKYEKGANRISASMLYRFAGVFGVPINVLFEGLDRTGEHGGGTSDIDSLLATAAEFQRLENPEVRRTIRSLVRLLSKSSGERGG